MAWHALGVIVAGMLSGVIQTPAHAQALFGPRTDLQVGTAPSSLSAVALNTDTKPDLVVTNYQSNSISVLRNSDGISFQRNDYPTGNRPTASVVGHLNADSYPDLVVANHTQGTLSFFRGRSGGTFATSLDYLVSVPISLAIADLNEDGHRDLVIAKFSANQVSVWLGRGDGTFGTKTDFPSGVRPQAVVVADFDGDGHTDVSAVNYVSNTLSVWRGLGDGQLGARTDHTTGAQPRALAAGDLNGDGAPDLVVVNQGSGTLQVFLGGGDFSFTSTVYTTGVNPVAVAIADLNRDLIQDVVVANSFSNTASIFLGDGAGTLGARIDHGTGAGPSAVAVADLTLDGIPDLVVSNQTDNNISIFPGLRGSPRIQVVPEALDFGPGFVGHPTALPLQLRNTGTEPLIVSELSVDTPEFMVTGATSFVVPVGQTRDAQIQIARSVAGTAIGTLTVFSNDSTRLSVAIPLTGNSIPPPVVRAVPDSLSFAVDAGQSTSGSLRIENPGQSTLAFAIQSNEGWLSAAPANGDVLPGQNLDLVVIANASALLEGVYSATLTVTSNDPAQPLLERPVRLVVDGDPVIQVDPDTLSFGTDALGHADTRVLQIMNVGTAPLTVSALSITGDPQFSLLDPAAFTAPPYEGRVVRVRFAREVVGTAHGALLISSDDPARPQRSVLLTGSTVEPPRVAVAPESLAFQVLPGEVGTASLTIENRGSSPLTFNIRDFGDGVLENSPEPLLKAWPLPAASPARDLDTLPWPLPRPTDRGIIAPLSANPVIRRPASYRSALIIGDGGTEVDVGAILTSAGYSITTVSDDAIWDGTHPAPTGFSVVVMLNGINYGSDMPTSGQVALKSYVEAGGGLVVTEWTALFAHFAGHYASMDDLLPISISGGASLGEFQCQVTGSHPITAGVNPTFSFQGAATLGLANSGEVLVTADGGNAMVVAKQVGHGHVAHFGVAGNYNDRPFLVPDMQRLLVNSVDWASGVTWLDAQPSSGTVRPGETRTITVEASAAELEVGAYRGRLEITTNDPERPQVVVPVHLLVRGEPDIELTPTSLGFEQGYVGYPTTLTLRVGNLGSDTLHVSGIITNAPVEVQSPTHFSVAAGGFRDVQIRYSRVAADTWSGMLHVVSDDPDEPDVSVSMTGGAIPPPVATVAPDTLAFEIEAGDTASTFLSISNIGGSDLTFDISHRALPVTQAGPLMAENLRTRGGPPQERAERDRLDVRPLALDVRREAQISRSVLVIADGGTEEDVSAILGNAGYMITQVVDDGDWNGTNPSPAGFDAVVLLNGLDYGRDMPVPGQQALQAYVESGGGLIVTEWTAYFAQYWNYYASMRALLAFYSTSYAEGTFQCHVLEPHPVTDGVSGPFNVTGAANLGSVTSGRAVIGSDGGAPLVMAKELGSGRIVHFAFGGNYRGRPFLVPQMQRLLVNAADWTSGWLTASPTSGTIPAGESESIRVHADARSLTQGLYVDGLMIATNDPARPTLRVGVGLVVHGTPDIAIETDTLRFGQDFVGYPDTLVLRVTNPGSDTVHVSGIDGFGPAFSALDPIAFAIRPRGDHGVRIRYGRPAAGDANSTLEIASNDPDEPVVRVALLGSALDPPIVSVAPESLSFTLASGDSAADQVAIRNDGLGALHFTLDATVGTAFSPPSVTIQPHGAEIPSSAERLGVSMGRAPPKPTVGGARLLIVRDYNPWGPASETILDGLGVPHDAIGSAQLATTDLGDYGVVIVSSAQDYVFYQRLHASAGKLNGFVTAGGILQMHAAYAAGVVLPGGVRVHERHDNWNEVAASAHPIVAGIPSSFYGNAASASGFSNLPAYAVRITRASNGDPTLIEYRLGAGRVVASGQTLEYGYYTGQPTGQILANMIAYTLSQSHAPWLAILPDSGTVAPGATLPVEVHARARGLVEGVYRGSIRLASDDPARSVVIVPVRLSVDGEPRIVVDRDTLEFGEGFVGYPTILSAQVKNEGKSRLTVSGVAVSGSEFTLLDPSPSTFTLAVGEWRDLQVRLERSVAGAAAGALAIASDDPSRPLATIDLAGFTVEPPAAAMFPESLTLTLDAGDSTTATVRLENSGLGPLTFEWISGANPVSSTRQKERTPVTVRGGEVARVDLAADPVVRRGEAVSASVLVIADGGTQHDVSAVLSAAGYDVTLVADDSGWYGDNPNPLSFSAVILLDGINAGSDMPVSGQLALLNHVERGGGLILTEFASYEVASGRYASMLPLIPMTFAHHSYGDRFQEVILEHPVTAHVSGWFSVTGHMSGGPPNSGTAVVRDASGYPSVVVKEYGAGRIVHFGVAGNAGGHRPFLEPNMQRLLMNAVEWTSVPPWLSLSPPSGSVAPQSSAILTIRASAAELIEGEYAHALRVVSNDPQRPVLELPVRLSVDGEPRVSADRDSLDFGTGFLGYPDTLRLRVNNHGTAKLIVSSVSASGAEFSPLELGGFELAVGQWRDLLVRYARTGVGPASGTLQITSDDPVDPLFTVALVGAAVHPPAASFYPDSLAFTLEAGDSASSALTIHNTGLGILHFRLDATGVLSATPPAVRLAKSESSTPPLASDPAGRTGTSVSRKLAAGRARALLVRDYDSWGPANDAILDQLGIPYDAIGSNELTTIDLTAYEWLIVPSYQPHNFYQLLQENQARITDYVASGGLLQFHAFGAHGMTLPGGVAILEQYDYWNSVVAPGHPIVAGIPSRFYGTQTSLATFSNLPIHALTITNDDAGAATLIEYRFGAGRIIASGHSLEYGYVYGQSAGQILANLMAYSSATAHPRWLSASPDSGVVAPGSSRAVVVHASARDLVDGSYRAFVRLESDDPVRPALFVPVALAVRGVPKIATADSLVFPPGFVGFPDSLPLLIRNDGSANLNVNAITVSGGEFSAAAAGFVIQPHGAVQVWVRLARSSAGPASGTLTLSSDDPMRPTVSVSLAGLSVHPPVALILPESLALQAASGSSVTGSLTIENSGLGVLDYSIAFTNGQPRWLSLDAENGNVPPSSSRSHVVTASAASLYAGSYQSLLKIATNDPARGAFDVPVTFTVTGTPRIGVEPDTLDFDSTYVGTAPSLFVQVLNRGTGLLHILDVGIEHPAFTLVGPTPAWIAPGNAAYLEVRFAPTAPGNVTGALTISSDDPQGPTQRITLLGVGRHPPVVATSPARFDAELDQDGTTDMFLSVRNDGLGLLRVTASSPAGWMQILPVTFTVAPSSKAMVTVRTSASGLLPGVFDSRVTLSTDDPSRPLVDVPVGLRVNGIPPGSLTYASPGDGLTNVNVQPELSWQPAARALTYDLYLWKAADPIPSVPTATGLTQTRYLPALALATNTSYRWKVVAVNATGSQPGPTWAFVTERLPDLRVTEVQPPRETFSGLTIQVAWVVKNEGDSPTNVPGWTDRLYLSASPIFEPGTAQYVAQVQNASYLAPGDEYAEAVSITLPQGISGDYYVHVLTDASSNLRESEEGDNASHNASPMVVELTPPPDLEVLTATGPVEAFGGDQHDVRWTVRNGGTGGTQVGSWSDGVYLSTSPTFSSGTVTHLASDHHSGFLPRNESYVGFARITIPRRIQGTYYLFVVTDIGNSVYEHAGENNNSARVASPLQITLTPPPDLRVVDLTAPLSASSGQFIDVSWRDYNAGPGPTFESQWQDRVHLSRSPTLDGSALTLETFGNVTGLEASQGWLMERRVRIPDGMSGDWFLFVSVDWDDRVFEYDAEGNNTERFAAAIPITLTPWADLRVVDITVPGRVVAGAPFSAQWRVRNVGAVATSRSYRQDAVFFSTSPTWNGGGYVTAVGHGGVLPSQEEYQGSVGLSVPVEAQGTYYVHVFTDYGGHEFEHVDENNNRTSSSPIQIDAIPRADLRPVSIDVPASASSGTSLPVTWIVRNDGPGLPLSGSFVDRFYLSADAVLSADDQPIGGVRREVSLPVGANAGRSSSVNIPNGVSGARRIIVVTDGDNETGEIHRGNNALASSEIDIQLTPAPDLAVLGITAPAQGIAGQPIRVNFEIGNQGPGECRPSQWYDGIYYSYDRNLDGSDPQLVALPHDAPLPAGSIYANGATVEIPSYAGGAGYLLVRADSRNSVYQAGVSDNDVAGVLIDVLVPPPSDLVVTSVDVPSSAVPGQPMTVAWTIENRGAFRATGYMSDAVFVTADAAFDVDDPRLGVTYRYVDLLPGQAQRVELTASIAEAVLVDVEGNVTGPAPGLAPGSYAVIVRTDIRNNIRESEDDNNSLVSSERTDISIEALTLGVALRSYAGQDESRYYRVVAPEGQTLRLSLDSYSDRAANELYVALDRPPTLSNFDHSYSIAFSPDQEIVVPSAANGTYYVLVHCRSTGGLANTYDIRADLMPLGISGVSLVTLGNAGPVTFDISGAHLDQLTSIGLRFADGNVRMAKHVRTRDPANVTVTFDLLGTPPGPVRLFGDGPAGAHVELDEPMSVVTSEGPDLIARMVGPADMRPGETVIWSLEYGNSGYNDAYDAVIWITGPPGVSFRIERPGFGPIPDAVPVANLSEPFIQGLVVSDLRAQAFRSVPILIRATASGEFRTAIVEQLPFDTVRVVATAVAREWTLLGFRDDENPQNGYVVFRQSAGFPPVGHEGVVVIISGMPYVIDAMISDPRDPLNYNGGIRRPIPYADWKGEAGTFRGAWQPKGWTPAIGAQIAQLARQYSDLEATNQSNTSYWFMSPQTPFDLPLFKTTGQDNAFNCIGFVENLLDRFGIGQIRETWSTPPGRHFEVISDEDWGSNEWVLWLGDPVGEGLQQADFWSDNLRRRTADLWNGTERWFTDSWGSVRGWFEKNGRRWKSNWTSFDAWYEDYWGWSGVWRFAVRRAVDPNDIIGPVGVGEMRWVGVQQSLPYAIRFENDSTAADAPARVVAISHELDPDLDARSFRLGGFGFDRFTFEVPANRSYYSGRLDLRDSIGLYVDVTGGLDYANRRAFWSLRAIDPVTGDLPVNALKGFLQPNDASGRGQGFVSYRIVASAGTPTGSSLDARASIVFDTNSPIETPPISNLVDAESPSTRVKPLPVETDTAGTLVMWSGSDAGSGIASFDVYVSRNHRPYEIWKQATRDTEATYFGQLGDHLEFYSVGTDSVGQREAVPTVADAHTTVGVPRPTPTLVVAVKTDLAPDRVRITWHAPVGRGSFSAEVERSHGAGDWVRRAPITIDASGLGTFEDLNVVAGERYRYRLVVHVDGVESHEGEVSVVVPGPPLALYGFEPNPAVGAPQIAFSLPRRAWAGIELIDVTGRRVHKQSFELPPGRHRVRLTNGPLAPGFYVVRLELDGRRLEKRGMVLK